MTASLSEVSERALGSEAHSENCSPLGGDFNRARERSLVSKSKSQRRVLMPLVDASSPSPATSEVVPTPPCAPTTTTSRPSETFPCAQLPPLPPPATKVLHDPNVIRPFCQQQKCSLSIKSTSSSSLTPAVISTVADGDGRM